MGCLAVLRALIEKRGVPHFIYTDKAGIYGGQKRQEFSHFEEACKELGINSMGKANEYLAAFLEKGWNDHFAVNAPDETPAYRNVPEGKSLKDIFCVKIDRLIKNNSTISFEGVDLVVAPAYSQPDHRYRDKIRRGNSDVCYRYGQERKAS